MAIVSGTWGFLFIMTPRTGSTAVASILRAELDGEYLPGESLLDGRGVRLVGRKHSTLQQLLKCGLLSEQDAAGLFKFTTVRNPFDSLVSLYLKLRENYQPLLADPSSWVYTIPSYVDSMLYCSNHSFQEWISWRLKRGGLRRFTRGRARSMYRRFVDGMDFVMRFERLQSDFDQALRRLGYVAPIGIPVVNRTDGRAADYRDYYTPKTRRLVESIYAEDLRTFGYEF